VSALPKRRYTAREYLVLERAASYKSEFYQGEIFAMAGASRLHNRIKDNLIVLIGSQLRGTGCYTSSSDQRVLVDENGLYTYPDIVIQCGAYESDPEDEDTMTNPTAIIEVLSDSTESYDRGEKFRLYRGLSSLREYVLVAQSELAIDRFSRQDDGRWVVDSTVGLDGVFQFSSLQASVRLADVYEGVEFADVG
jgi:Uma2 family endonuclease